MKKTVIICAVLVLLIGGGLFCIPRTLDSHGPEASQKKKVPEKTLAQKTVEAMTLEEKVGQLFLVCVPGSSINPENMEVYKPAGYLLFAPYFEYRARETAAADIAALQAQSHTPLLFAVDEEGGTVLRVSRFSAYRESPFPSPLSLYQEGGMDLVLAREEEKADLLLSLGINVNLAPVCDMAADKASFIYDRTLGEDVKTTATYISEMVTLMKEKKIGSALKHFPGYGQNTDTHTGIARDSRPYEAFEQSDFLPFQAGIDAGAPCVLVSHNIVQCMDEKNPASLSSEVHRVLREKLGFQGVIMTDDLSMEGVQAYSGDDNIAVAAIKAGNDLLCTSDYQTQIQAVLDAVADGNLSEEQVAKSALRVLSWKEELGILKAGQKAEAAEDSRE